MKACDTLISSIGIELQDAIKDLVYHQEDIRKIFLAIQLCAEKLAKDRQYLTRLTVDFANDYAVTLEAAAKKPKGWDCNFIRDGLLRICKGLSSEGLVMYAVTLRYGQRVIIEVGEDVELKFTALDFIKPRKVHAGSDSLAGSYVNG